MLCFPFTHALPPGQTQCLPLGLCVMWQVVFPLELSAVNSSSVTLANPCHSVILLKPDLDTYHTVPLVYSLPPSLVSPLNVPPMNQACPRLRDFALLCHLPAVLIPQLFAGFDTSFASGLAQRSHLISKAFAESFSKIVFTSHLPSP